MQIKRNSPFVGVRRHEPALREVRAEQSRILGVFLAACDNLELARVLVDAAFVPPSAPPAPVGAFEYFVLAERDVLLLRVNRHDVILIARVEIKMNLPLGG